MTNQYVKPAAFDKVIRAVASVRTRGGFASWNLLLLFFGFNMIFFFGREVTSNQMWLIVAFCASWQAFAIFALMKLPITDAHSEQLDGSRGVKSETRQSVSRKKAVRDT